MWREHMVKVYKSGSYNGEIVAGINICTLEFEELGLGFLVRNGFQNCSISSFCILDGRELFWNLCCNRVDVTL